MGAATRSSLARCAGALLLEVGRHDVQQLDAIELGPDVAEPVPHVAAQHERIVFRLALRAFVGDEDTNGTEASSTCSQAISLSLGMVTSAAPLILRK